MTLANTHTEEMRGRLRLMATLTVVTLYARMRTSACSMLSKVVTVAVARANVMIRVTTVRKLRNPRVPSGHASGSSWESDEDSLYQFLLGEFPCQYTGDGDVRRGVEADGSDDNLAGLRHGDTYACQLLLARTRIFFRRHSTSPEAGPRQ